MEGRTERRRDTETLRSSETARGSEAVRQWKRGRALYSARALPDGFAAGRSILWQLGEDRCERLGFHAGRDARCPPPRPAHGAHLLQQPERPTESLGASAGQVGVRARPRVCVALSPLPLISPYSAEKFLWRAARVWGCLGRASLPPPALAPSCCNRPAPTAASLASSPRTATVTQTRAHTEAQRAQPPPRCSARPSSTERPWTRPSRRRCRNPLMRPNPARSERCTLARISARQQRSQGGASITHR